MGTFLLISPLMGLFCIIFKILCIVFFAMWVYKDTKAKNLETLPWVLLSIFSTFIGVIVYLIYSKNKPIAYHCTKCGKCSKIGETFCTGCGSNDFTNIAPKGKNVFLYIGIITFVISIIFNIFTIVMLFVKIFSFCSDIPYNYDLFDDNFFDNAPIYDEYVTGYDEMSLYI